MSTTNNKTGNKESSINNEHLLPWLVNGTLSEKEKKDLEAAVEGSEKLQKEKELLTHLRDQIKQQELPDAPIEFAWSKMKKQIASENKTPQKIPESHKKWRLAAIAASLALVIQSATLMIPSTVEERFTPLTTTPQTLNSEDVLLTLKFVDTATLAEINTLLREYQLSIISGPSSAGIFRVTSKNKSDNLVDKLEKRTDVVAHVQQD